MIAMPRVGSGGRATAVVKSHYPKNLIFISRQDCVAGAHTCLPRMTIEPRARVDTASCPDRGFFTLLPLQPSLQRQCPLSGVKQTSRFDRATSAFDPKRTSDLISTWCRFCAHFSHAAGRKVLRFRHSARRVSGGTYSDAIS
jgi:hypothetical protein